MSDKLSINDMVESGFHNFMGRDDFQTEVSLDELMPRVHSPDEGFVLYSVQQAIATQLSQEYWTHGRGNRRISTTFEGDTQILRLDHCGEPIPPDKIQFLNETLKMISDGQDLDSNRFRPSGNNNAARGLREKGGTIEYENINDGDYRVRCTVTLPLNQ